MEYGETRVGRIGAGVISRRGPPPFPVRGLEDFGVAPWGGAGARETAEKDEVASKRVRKKKRETRKGKGGVSGFRKHGIQEPRWKKW